MAKRLLSRVLALAVVGASLGGCATVQNGGVHLSERECMARVMYFESNRSSDDGMLAVGTVVMNRLESGKYPKTVCGVVGQDRQFADGALTNHVNKRHWSWAKAERAADAVLAGERHDGVGDAKFFHTAGYKFPYRNMKYVTLAGGNIFYEKRYPAPGAPAWPSASMFAAAQSKPASTPKPTMLARADLSSASAQDGEEDAYAPATARREAPTRAERQPAVSAPKPVMLARAETGPDIEEDEEDEPVARTPAPRKAPLGVAPTAAPVRAKPQPIVVASLQAAPVPRWRPGDIAATLRAVPPSHPGSPPAKVGRAAGPVLAAKAVPPSKAETGRPVPALAAVQPPSKPKPIVVAMLNELKGRTGQAPRSIADILAMDGQGRRAPR